MNIHNLDPIFNPQRIALIGVTTNPNSVSGKVLINLVSGGFRGVVYPVNPDHEAVMGIPCYPGYKEPLPKVPDLGIICTPAEKVAGVIRECGERDIPGMIIISQPDSRRLGKKEKTGRRDPWPGKKIRRYADHRPELSGVIVPSEAECQLCSCHAKAGQHCFHLSIGALCTSVLDWAMEGKIGFSQFVSIGNSLDVEFGDLIDYFGEDENTHCIILYIESIPMPGNS
jgi:acetyltransferase